MAKEEISRNQEGTFQRHRMIIRIVRERTTPIRMKELLEKVKREIELAQLTDEIGVSISTLQRDIKSIKKIYKIHIDQLPKQGGYVLTDESDKLEMQLEHLYLLNILDRDLEDIVFPEKRKSKMIGSLYDFISAIRNNKRIEFEYKKFDNTSRGKRLVEPYALKEFKGRWYLLAVEVGERVRFNERGKIKTWGLDRIVNLFPTIQHFNKSSFINIEKEFKDAFGIHSDETKKAEKVILLFSPIAGRYNNSFPLHESQIVKTNDNGEFTIELNVKITYDFIMEILSQSQDVKVIAPQHLKDTLIEIHKKALTHSSILHVISKLYSNKKERNGKRC